ncbi:AraC family transcriptional regulator [Paenibacillus sp. FSL R5-0527]|uniref:helix-turn-helix domain-containing protein n=1 Tax=Paenibacillus TaxID=44249 RepID=UPI000979F9D7|nr:AraC family transcriptional regulator [Paenibacillus macerans]MED4956648.1 AraC family transcriptional regulator [Paenibacillus macerans]OMG46113.1 AraC family transcriptional regulator [Paenibacillus macerans]
MTERYPEIDEVIAYIQQNIHEPLPLPRLAKYAAYSPFHFSRIFKERMGLPPLYYVSAMRLQKAKDLLLRTDMTIRDIGLEIGQQSLGTFTTRFTERVGMTPSDFRNSIRHAGDLLRSLQHFNEGRLRGWKMNRPGNIGGTVQAASAFSGVIFIGLFAKPIPEGLPLYGTLLFSLGEFCFTGVKPGTYYLMATSLDWGTNANDILLPQRTLRTRFHHPIAVKPGIPVPYQEVMLYPPRADDPPILISLSVLMNRFLRRSLQKSNR